MRDLVTATISRLDDGYRSWSDSLATSVIPANDECEVKITARMRWRKQNDSLDRYYSVSPRDIVVDSIDPTPLMFETDEGSREHLIDLTDGIAVNPDEADEDHDLRLPNSMPMAVQKPTLVPPSDTVAHSEWCRAVEKDVDTFLGPLSSPSPSKKQVKSTEALFSTANGIFEALMTAYQPPVEGEVSRPDNFGCGLFKDNIRVICVNSFTRTIR